VTSGAEGKEPQIDRRQLLISNERGKVRSCGARPIAHTVA
jgi:hypothetical protein